MSDGSGSAGSVVDADGDAVIVDGTGEGDEPGSGELLASVARMPNDGPIRSAAVFGSIKSGKTTLLHKIFGKLCGVDWKTAKGAADVLVHVEFVEEQSRAIQHHIELPDLRLTITENTGRMYATQEWQAAMADLCIFVVDVTDPECLLKLGRWLSLIGTEHRFSGNVVIVGNKIDLARSVSHDMALSWCEARGGAGVLPYFETSAIEGTGVDELVEEMRRLLPNRGPLTVPNPARLRQALAGPPSQTPPRAWCPAVCCPCACPGLDANWFAESEECSCVVLPCMCGNVFESYLCGVVPCGASSVATRCDCICCCCCNGCGFLPWCAYRADLEQPLLDGGFTTTSMQRWGLPMKREREPDEAPRARPRCFPACCCVHPCLRPRDGYPDIGRAGLPFQLDFVAHVCRCCVQPGPMNDGLECSTAEASRCFETLCCGPCYVAGICCYGICCPGLTFRRRQSAGLEREGGLAAGLIDEEAGENVPPATTVMERDRAAST